jgi:hypothetical protein
MTINHDPGLHDAGCYESARFFPNNSDSVNYDSGPYDPGCPPADEDPGSHEPSS